MTTIYEIELWKVILPWCLFAIAVIGNVVGWWIARVLHRSNGLAMKRISTLTTQCKNALDGYEKETEKRLEIFEMLQQAKAESRESAAAHQEAVRKLELESQTKAARAQDLFNDNVRLTEELNRFKPEIASVPIKIKFHADGRNPSILGKTFTHPAGGIIRVSAEKKPKKPAKPVKKAKSPAKKKVKKSVAKRKPEH